MKIEIDFMDDFPYHQQTEAVNNYIKDNTTGYIKHEGFIGFYYVPIVQETKKDTGQRVRTEDRDFHVSCRRTKGGIYKFKVWQAV